MMSATSIRGRSPAARRVKVSRRELLLIAQHLVDLGHGGEAGGIDLGGAAGDDDAGLGILAPGLADRLARLARRLGGDGAGVDHDGALAAPPRRHGRA